MNETRGSKRWGAARQQAGERRIRQLLETAGRRPEVPARDLAVIRAAARAEWRERLAERAPRRWSLAPAALAAALIIAVVAGWWWWGDIPAGERGIAVVELLEGFAREEGPETGPGAGGRALAVGEEVALGSELATAAGSDGSPSLLALRLAGGQSLRLAADTRVRLLGDSSLELLRGAIYIDSGRVAGHTPVEVVTAVGSVREIGTQFEVRVSEGDGTLRVRVREGAVAVDRGASSHPAAAGEELTLRRDGAVERVRVATHGEIWSWVLAAAPGFDIEGATLRDFLGWVSRETGWQVRYADEAIAESAATIQLHGTIEGLHAEEAVAAVLAGSGLGYRVHAGILEVEDAPSPSVVP